MKGDIKGKDGLIGKPGNLYKQISFLRELCMIKLDFYFFEE